MKTESCDPLLSWTIIDGAHIPSFQRKGCEFIPVRLVESTLLSPFPKSQDLKDSPLVGQLMTATEAALLNSATSDELLNSSTDVVPYSTKDLVVKMTDFLSFYQRVKEHFSVDFMTGGWLQINNVVLPYVVRETSRVVPLDIVRLGGQILTDVDLGEYVLHPVESERVFLNRSLKLCGFDYRLEATSKLVDLNAVWMFCSLTSTQLTVRELPGKDPISEAGYDVDAAEGEDHTLGTPSPVLSDDSGIDVARGQADVKPILITPIVRSDSIICLFDDECSDKVPSCLDSVVEDSVVSHGVGSVISATESARQHIQSVLESCCDDEQPAVSGVSKRKRISPLGSKKDKSKLRKVSATLPDANTTPTTFQKSTPAPTLTSPARAVDSTRTMSFENSHVTGGQPPAYPSTPNGDYTANWLNVNSFNRYPYAPRNPYGHPLPGLTPVQSLTSGQYQVQPEPNSQHIFGSRPPLVTISGTSLTERSLGTNNPTTYHLYDTASRARTNLNPSVADAGFCVDGAGIASQRSALPQQQNMSTINGPAASYFRNTMMGQNSHCQNIKISSQHTDRTAYYANNYTMRQVLAQNNESDIRSGPFDNTSPDANNVFVNSNRIIHPHAGNRIMHSGGYGKSIHANGTSFYQGSATGCLPGNSYVQPVANVVGTAVANGPAVPGVIRVRIADQLKSMSGAYQNPAQQIPPAVHGIAPYARPGNNESQFSVSSRQNAEFGSRTMMPSIQQQQQQQSGRMQYLNSQSVSNASRMLEMHQSAARQGLYRAQASTHGNGAPPQSNIAAPAVPTPQVDPRAFRYGFTKPWRVLARLANGTVILTACVVGKEVVCLARRDGLFAPLESLHELLFAEYYSLDDWLYMMYVTFGAATIELGDEEIRSFEIWKCKNMHCRRAISLGEFYKHLEHFGMR